MNDEDDQDVDDGEDEDNVAEKNREVPADEGVSAVVTEPPPVPGDGGEVVSADTRAQALAYQIIENQAADVAMNVDDATELEPRPWRTRTARAQRHAGEPHANLVPITEAQIQSTLQVLWAMEREELHRMTDTAMRATRLDHAWMLKPNDMTFAESKAANPLWARPTRLWTAAALKPFHRLCKHRR